MKRKMVTVLVVLVALLSMTGCNVTSICDGIFRMSPQSIECTTTTVESVKLLCENVLVVDVDSSIATQQTSSAKGVASFQVGERIYMFGHDTDEPVGSWVLQVDSVDGSTYNVHKIGEVVRNSKRGVIAETSQDIEEYSDIPVAKTIELGEAFRLERDKNGDICKYPITIESIDGDNGKITYSSDERQFVEGTSGSPIIQNDQLIGVHYAGKLHGKTGYGRIIWDLDIVLP